jgi:hypothetical protein
MSEPTGFSRQEIAASLERMGVKDVDDVFLSRCVELSANTRRSLAMLPPPPDKGLEAAHVFTVALTKK